MTTILIIVIAVIALLIISLFALAAFQHLRTRQIAKAYAKRDDA